ncbi:uncharacterized protein KY384_005879 [Bacidia gigantensis]|uniref:uncharacterized protein n=1 Tax=Bacidia gigantensis TaxID=2732470 RepID=UPI001D057607|nr:uncharacterized protein KY384_005879 [Bacidia gigantensis]KAG8529244.1 hypothetical protein KY384_005879 [Bacidia gigantensis]
MPSSPLAEAPHYNGLTLSPASPKPIHVPDSQTVPVLQNQADGEFNLAAYMENATSGQGVIDSTGLDHYQVAPTQEASATTIATLNGEVAGEQQPIMKAEDVVKESQDQVYSTIHASTEHPDVSTGHAEFASAPENIHPFASEPNHGQNLYASVQDAFEQQPIQADNSYPQADSSTALDQSQPENPETSPKKELTIETGNIQALLDNLIASASTAPAADSVQTSAPAPTASAGPQVSSPSSAQTPISALPTPAGLPPRPPPQDEPTIHPNYTAGQSIRSYHNPPPPNTTQTSTGRLPPNHAPASTVGPNGLPPPPAASFQQSIAPSQPSPQEQTSLTESSVSAAQPDAPPLIEPQQAAAAPDTDSAYQDFLREEASYVAEGTWDRFPQGSRLFLGNLFTEKVSKRMIFDVFSKYGRLAQISMKNAYGFVQFVDPGCSSSALVAEEGTELGGRKIHLEISKPQKNTRNAGNSGNADRAGRNRRSRSPDYGRGSNTRQGIQHVGQNPYGVYERRTRDDYRPVRSPSPRRGYDNHLARNGLDRYYGGKRSRSRSPPYGRNGRYRSRSPQGRDLDDERTLPIPRRNPVQVPDVQIIIVDESDRTFVGYIQQSFRDRSLRCDVLQLPRGVSLQAVIKRQILEGVQAVVKIHRKSQVTGKIPLQLFDRSGGPSNIRFDEYEELDAAVAADVVIRSKQPQAQPMPQSQHYPQNPGYGPPQHQVHQMPQQHMPPHSMPQQQPPVPNVNTTPMSPLAGLDGPALQKLLGSLNQNPSNPQQYQGNPQPGQAPQDLAALLSSVARQTPQQQQNQQQGYQLPQTPTQGYQYQNPPQHQQFPPQSLTQPGIVATARSSTTTRKPPQQGYQAIPPPQQPPQQQNVQDIMAQLAKYRQ